MFNVICAGLIVFAAAEIEVRSLDGEDLRGKLVRIDGENVVVDTNGGVRSLALNVLMRIQPSGVVRPAETFAVAIDLIDGSTCLARQCVVRGDRVEVSRPFGPAELPADGLRAVRFVEADDSLLKEWNGLLGQAGDSDRLVLQRGETLNYHSGIVRGVSADRVVFELDGETLNVKRANVFGLVYHRAAGRELPPSLGMLRDATGSRWTLRSLSFDADVFRVTTTAGVEFDLPITQVVDIDFSEGKVVYLGDLPWRVVEWTPYFGLRDELPARRAFFAPRFDRSTGQAALTLDGKRYARGVTLRSRTEIDFELPEGYRRFKAVMGIDDAFRPHGNARLVIRGDGRELIAANPTGTAAPETIDIDISGVRRLSIVVDFGQDMDLGDWVNLCEARIVK